MINIDKEIKELVNEYIKEYGEIIEYHTLDRDKLRKLNIEYNPDKDINILKQRIAKKLNVDAVLCNHINRYFIVRIKTYSENDTYSIWSEKEKNYNYYNKNQIREIRISKILD
jgi:hypothetical protein